MKITALVENTSARGLPAEHGLSLFVETETVRFLFDAGQTALFSQNARALGIDLDTADFAVLSHGHYDHGGGLAAFLEINGHAPVYMTRHAFGPHYNAAERYIGLDPRLESSDRIVFADGTLRIAEGITLYGMRDAPMIVPADPCGLKMRLDGRMREEDFRHEQYLLVEEHGKRTLFSGCSHRGIRNIMHWFRPDTLIGGFHLSTYPVLPGDGPLDAVAEALDAYPAAYYTCHCTGAEQYRFMKTRMKNLHYLSTGEIVTV